MNDILYIEDCRDTARAVKIILEAAGFNVDLAFTGKKGLKKILKKNYDLVILDIMLPDISGIEIFKKICEVKKKEKCRYAFLSIVSVPSGKMEELNKISSIIHIGKPFERDDLIKRVKELLGVS